MKRNNFFAGEKFGKLEFLKEIESKGTGVRCLLRCDCGNLVERHARDLKSKTINGHVCMCLDCKSSLAAKNGIKNNRGKMSVSHKKIYDVHRQMLRRCYDESSADFKNYGYRGISVCDQWKAMVGFVSWCESSGYTYGMTIERIDVNGNYEPKNCTWVPNAMQAKNTRKSVRIAFNGITKPLVIWANELGISSKTVKGRLRRGWSVSDSLMVKPHKGRNQHFKDAA